MPGNCGPGSGYSLEMVLAVPGCHLSGMNPGPTWNLEDARTREVSEESREYL